MNSADLIEIGMPFTAPMADGPIIQAAAKRGLAAGAKVAGVQDMVRAFQEADEATPVAAGGQSIKGGGEEAEGFVNPAAQAGACLPFSAGIVAEFAHDSGFAPC